MNEINKSANKTASYTIASFYNHYLSNIEPNTIYDIPYDTYRKIIVDYFQYIRDEVLENSKEVKLPYRMGSFKIVKSRPKHLDKRSLRIDYLSTKELGKLVYLLNEHSSGFKYRAYWNKLDVLIKNKMKYQLVMTRANKRKLASLIKSQQKDYEEL